MTNKYLHLIFLSFIWSLSVVNAQNSPLLETNKHLFWQADRPLKKEDFKGSGARFLKHNDYCAKYNYCTMAYVGLFTTMDIPKKESARGKLLEKAYFVPVFEKTSSYILKKDTEGIKKQQIIFDIYELSARFARKKLLQYNDSLPGYGSTTFVFKTVEADAAEFRKEMLDAYTNDIYILQKEGSYAFWRKEIDALLQKTERFATQPDDCKRAMNGAPLNKKYITPKQFISDLKADERD